MALPGITEARAQYREAVRQRDAARFTVETLLEEGAATKERVRQADRRLGAWEAEITLLKERIEFLEET